MPQKKSYKQAIALRTIRGKMEFNEVTREALFIKRYKRFFADVEMNGSVVTTLVPNTGSLKTCLFEGAACVISESTNPTRKLKSTLQFIKTPTSWVGVNTNLPNQLVYEAWQQELIEDWRSYRSARLEYKISKETRLDLVLAREENGIPAKFDPRTKPSALRFIEIKNVTMAEGGVAFFPDAVTTRGQKHLRELMALAELGHEAEIVFVVQRMDCKAFSPADQIDPDYGRLLRQAREAGVHVRAFGCSIEPLKRLSLRADPLKIEL